MSNKMVFAADIVPTKNNIESFKQGDVEHLFGNEMLSYLNSVDFRCFNLEVSLTACEMKANYPGPHLMAEPETIHAIQKLSPDLLTIGNNHALDQGQQGLLSTMSVLQNAQIPFTGAGVNFDEACKPFVTHIDDTVIGIYNCSEYEFAGATENTCGVNLYDPLRSFDDVRALKNTSDVVVVLYHGGKELYRYPSPDVRRVCRKFVECGANLVICQHTHCIGCAEEYEGGTIVYGQGNFLFEGREDERKNTGFFVECEVEGKSLKQTNYVPFYKENECVRLAGAGKAREILDAFEARNAQIQQHGFVEAEYDRLALEQYAKYVSILLGNKRVFRWLNKLTGGKFFDNFYSPKKALAVLNVISPENHAELFKAALRLKGRIV